MAIELLNRETNPRVLMRRKVHRLQQELNRPDLRSCYDADIQQQTPTRILLNGIVRPLKMLFFSPIIFLLSLYMSVAYGLLYLLFTTITQVFTETYNWDPDICGLAYIGLGIGRCWGRTPFPVRACLMIFSSDNTSFPETTQFEYLLTPRLPQASLPVSSSLQSCPMQRLSE